MNISTRSRTNITKTLNSVSEGEDKKLYETRRAAKKVGFDSKDVTNENVDTYTEMFFQQLGVSVEECPRDYSFLKNGSKKPEQTTKSFENQDDPFYEPDCGSTKPKQNKKRQDETKFISDMTYDLQVDISDEIDGVATTQESQVFQFGQQEGSFSASTGIANTGLSTEGFGATGFQDATRNTTSTSGRSKTNFYKFSY